MLERGLTELYGDESIDLNIFRELNLLCRHQICFDWWPIWKISSLAHRSMYVNKKPYNRACNIRIPEMGNIKFDLGGNGGSFLIVRENILFQKEVLIEKKLEA